MVDEVHRAYAKLGLPVGSSFEDVRRRYKKLVRKWHPDRFANDPDGQAEAERQLRAINVAYKVLEDREAIFRSAQVGSQARPTPNTSGSSPPPGQPLSREEIDRWVRGLGTKGPVDDFLESLSWAGPLVISGFLLYGLVRDTTCGLDVLYLILAVALVGLAGIVRARQLRKRE